MTLGSLLTVSAEVGIPNVLPKPDRPLAKSIYAGCRATLDVSWENFPRFEWCVDYFVKHPNKALCNTNFLERMEEWLLFIREKLREQVEKNPTLVEVMKACEDEEAHQDVVLTNVDTLDDPLEAKPSKESLIDPLDAPEEASTPVEKSKLLGEMLEFYPSYQLHQVSSPTDMDVLGEPQTPPEKNDLIDPLDISGTDEDGGMSMSQNTSNSDVVLCEARTAALNSTNSSESNNLQYLSADSIDPNNTILRVENTVAGTVMVLEQFKHAAYEDLSFMNRIGLSAAAGLSKAIKLGKKLYRGLKAMKHMVSEISEELFDEDVLDLLFSIL